MSHIVQIQTQVRDPIAIQHACNRLGLPATHQGKFRLFSGEVEGYRVELTGWKYPLVCQTESGEVKYDNYGGRWGDPKRLDEFLQSYAVEKTRIEARRKGHTVAERRQQDGSIQLTVTIGAAAGGAV